METRVKPRWKARGVAAAMWGWAPVIGLGIVAVMTLALARPAHSAPPTVAGATYVGGAKCLECHEDVAKGMQHTLHGKLLGTGLAKGDLQPRGCEACHGPGSKHLEDQANPAYNLRFGKNSKQSAAEKNAVCLQCHAKGQRMLWAGSQHEARDVTCMTCHGIHGPVSGKAQLRLVRPEQYDSRGQAVDAVQYDLCGQCHAVKAMQWNRSSHMPLRARGEAGSITCTTCHNPHGTTSPSLIRAISINEQCLSCHAGKRGPFLYEHPPVVENCMNCHFPHGGNNAFLLRVKPPRLCETCHVGGRHNAQTYPMTDRRVYNRACPNCHANIHGSNHPSGRDFTR